MANLQLLDEVLIDKYRRFEPGIYETEPHQSDQWADSLNDMTDLKTQRMNHAFDRFTGENMATISKEINSRLRHIRIDRSPRQKTNRKFGSKLLSWSVMFDGGSKSVGAGIMDLNLPEMSDNDIMLSIMKLPSRYIEHVVEILPMNAGYAWLNFTHVPEEIRNKILHKEDLFVWCNAQIYLSAPAVKTWKALDQYNSDDWYTRDDTNEESKRTSPAIKLKLSRPNPAGSTISTDFNNTRTDSDAEPVKPETLTETIRNAYEKNQKIDLVPCVGFIGWPEVAKEFKMRAWERFGEEILEEIILTGFHLVPKTRPMNGNIEKDWRLSFSAAEGILIDHWSENQIKCFICLKIMLKNLNNPPDIGLSYILKTLMLWAVERQPPSVWEDAPFSLCLLGILDTMIHVLSQNYLPHYFIPGVNALSGELSHGDTAKVLNLLNKVRYNPSELLPKLESKKQNITRFDLKWYLAYDHENNQIDKLSLSMESLDNINKNWSKFIVNLAVLTREDLKLRRATEAEGRITEVLLKATAIILQEIIISTKTDIEACPLKAGDTTVLEIQAEQLKYDNVTKNETKPDPYQMVVYNFKEIRIQGRLTQVFEILIEELQYTQFRRFTEEDVLFEYYMEKLLSGDAMTGINKIEVCENTQWYRKFKNMTLKEFANQKKALFTY